MGIDKHALDHLGYDQEEAYFYRLNRELIRKRKQSLEQERTRRRPSEKKCLKCGIEMPSESEKPEVSGFCPKCRGR